MAAAGETRSLQRDIKQFDDGKVREKEESKREREGEKERIM